MATLESCDLAGLSPPDDESIGALVVSSLLTQRLVAPSVDRTLSTSNRRFGFTTSMGVVTRRFHNAAHVRASAEAAILTGLTDLFVLMLSVADFADGGAAGVVHHAHFAAGKAERDIRTFLGHNLGGGTGASHHLASLLWLEFDVVDQCTERDVTKLEAVAGQNVCAFPAHDLRADTETLGGQDVALFAIGIFQQRDAARSVRIVFDRDDIGSHRILVSLEVDDSVFALVSTGLVETRSSSVVVQTTRLLQANRQTLLRLALCYFAVG